MKAFPNYSTDQWGRPIVSGGMNMRQYYAAQAMQALIARTGIWGEDELASNAFRIADAMLKEEKRCSSPATSTT